MDELKLKYIFYFHQQDFRALNSFDTGTDHGLVRATMNLRTNKRKRYVQIHNKDIGLKELNKNKSGNNNCFLINNQFIKKKIEILKQ